ncbi:hypothetical protein GF342_06050, partial [Candidatus Woesearchaeota archaeon]|nr:hypothetical protein [Candidatus Woesearchaeota archaeon]
MSQRVPVIRPDDREMMRTYLCNRINQSYECHVTDMDDDRLFVDVDRYSVVLLLHARERSLESLRDEVFSWRRKGCVTSHVFYNDGCTFHVRPGAKYAATLRRLPKSDRLCVLRLHELERAVLESQDSNELVYFQPPVLEMS